MHVPKVNNTNFLGLYRLNSNQSNEKNQVKYLPYSWEEEKAAVTEYDIKGCDLPDNEAEVIRNGDVIVKKDILGTVFYDKKGEQNLIGDMSIEPRMTLTESLETKIMKLNEFKDKKLELMKKIQEPFSKKMAQIKEFSENHSEYASDISKGIFSHKYSNKDREVGVKKNFAKLVKVTQSIGNDFILYTKIVESLGELQTNIKMYYDQMFKIQLASMDNSLIDISNKNQRERYDIMSYTLLNKEENKEKLLCLPHRAIPFADIIKIYENKKNFYNIFEYVENMIKNRL